MHRATSSPAKPFTTPRKCFAVELVARCITYARRRNLSATRERFRRRQHWHAIGAGLRPRDENVGPISKRFRRRADWRPRGYARQKVSTSSPRKRFPRRLFTATRKPFIAGSTGKPLRSQRRRNLSKGFPVGVARRGNLFTNPAFWAKGFAVAPAEDFEKVSPSGRRLCRGGKRFRRRPD